MVKLGFCPCGIGWSLRALKKQVLPLSRLWICISRLIARCTLGGGGSGGFSQRHAATMAMLSLTRVCTSQSLVGSPLPLLGSGVANNTPLRQFMVGNCVDCASPSAVLQL